MSEISATLIGERYPTVFDTILVVITIIICPSSAYEYMACAIIKVRILRNRMLSVYVCTHDHNILMSLYIHMCMFICVYVYMYICTYICVYVYAHTNT